MKILGVGRPTIGDYIGEDITIETIADSSITMAIDQAKYFAFEVDDVDRAQSIEGLMEALMDEATTSMAQTLDSFIAEKFTEAEQSIEATIDSADAAKAALDEAILTLRENDVAIGDKVVIELAPFFHQYVRDFLGTLKTDNDQLISSGVIGTYDGCKVKLSNNLYNDGDATYCAVRTPKAVAFAMGIDKIEAFRPQLRFSDAVKGLQCYGAKIIRPKEIVTIKATKTAPQPTPSQPTEQ